MSHFPFTAILEVGKICLLYGHIENLGLRKVCQTHVLNIMCRPYRWRLSIPAALIPSPTIPMGIWDPVGTCVCPSPTVPAPLAWAVSWRSQGSSFPWRPCPSLCAFVNSWAVRSSISPRGPSPHSTHPLASSVSSRAPALPLLTPRPPLSPPLFSSFVGPLPFSP